MRWGNYDTVKASAQWNSSEVPSSLSQYANPVPSSQNLPDSFYLTSTPAWWGNNPWPGTGPDVSGGTDATGHSYPNPAQTCYSSSTKGSNGILTFNAATCYSNGVVVQPPSNLTAVAH